MSYNEEYYKKHRDSLRQAYKEYHASHRKEVAARKKARYDSNREKDRLRNMINRAKDRARKRGVPFSITEADVVIPDVCPILGVPLDKSFENRRFSPSLDCVVSSRGYVSGNVAVISFRANAIKNEGSAEEHRKIANWMDKREIENS